MKLELNWSGLMPFRINDVCPCAAVHVANVYDQIYSCLGCSSPVHKSEAFISAMRPEHMPLNQEKQSFSPKPQKPACVQLNLFDNE